MEQPRFTYSRAETSRDNATLRQSKKNKFRVEDHYLTVDSPTGEKHVCKQKGCTKSFKRGTSSTHKKRHMETHVNRNSTSTFRLMPRSMQEAEIVKFVATTGSPFSLVEHPRFRFITDTKFCRKTISLKSKEMCNKQKQSIATKLGGVDHVALTMDIWTSIAIRSYLCITLHYASSSGTIISELIHFASIDPPHTGSCIKEQLERAIDSYGIDEKVVAITADGAANENAAINQMNSIRSIRQLFEVRRIYCVAHLINNVVTQALEYIEPLIEKVRNITFTIKASSSLTFKLKKSQREAGKTPLTVVKDVRTRWNSCYMMIERYIKLQDYLTPLISNELALRDYALSGEEMSDLRDYLHVLRPFKIATDYFSCNRSQNLGAVVPIYREMITKMKNAMMIDSTNRMSRKLLDALETRRDRFESSHGLLATALDPYWKSSTYVQRAELMIVLEDALKIVSIDTDDTANANSRESRSNSELFSEFSRPMESEACTGDLDDYLSDVSSSDIKYHDWWRLNRKKYPKIHNLAMQFMIIRSTSVASEAKFSIAGNMIGTRRSQLDEDSVEAIMFINSTQTALNPRDGSEDELDVQCSQDQFRDADDDDLG